MKIITKTCEKNTSELYEIIDQLQTVLAKTKTELAQEKLKTAYLLEQFRLAKQKAFAPQSEKNILQADLFDETGLETESKAEEENIEVKNHTRKKHPKRKSILLDLPRERIVPLYRQAKIWERISIDLPLSTFCHWLNQTAEKCEPLVTLLHHNIVKTDYINADETPFQVLKEAGRKNTSQSYFGLITETVISSSITSKPVVVIMLSLS